MNITRSEFEKMLEAGILRYFERDGTLCYEYKKRVRYPTTVHIAVFRDYTTSGEVPDNVYQAGKEAIRNYVESVVKKEIREAEARINALDEYARNPDFRIETNYDDKKLLGKIVSADDSTLRVRLDTPYVGEDSVHYGFGSAMSGKHIFENGTFTENAIIAAERLLVRIYEREKHREAHKAVIELAELLNKKD